MGFFDFLPVIGNVIDGFFGQQAADAQRDWQTAMSNTAHQREVKDLRAAGLNPILSAFGHGANVPSGAMAPPTRFGEGMSSALQLRTQDAQIDNLKSSAMQARTQALKNSAEAKLANVTANNAAMLGYDPTKGGVFSQIVQGVTRNSARALDAIGDYKPSKKDINTPENRHNRSPWITPF